LLEGGNYLTRSDIQTAGGGITRESAAVWTARDDLQQKLVQLGRRLPYELPALYVAQRAVTDPLFGHNQDKKKVKWYNPADVLADFAKQSVYNIASITGMGAVGGAALGRAKFYYDIPYASNPNLSLTAKQMARANRVADLRTILEEVGQDFSKIAGETTKYMSSAGAAFNYAVEQGKQNQVGPVQAMYRARGGPKAAALAAERDGKSKLNQAGQYAKAFFVGFDDTAQSYYGAIDTIPAFRGFSVGLRSFNSKFRDAKIGHDVISGSKSFADAVSLIRGPSLDATNRLEDAIRAVQGQHRSKFSSYAETVNQLMGKGGPGGGAVDDATFAQVLKTNVYKEQLAANLRRNGASDEAADKFVRSLNVVKTPRTSRGMEHASVRIQIGKNRILSQTDDDFYDTVTKIFRKANPEVEDQFTNDALKRSISATDALFTKKEFQKRLNAKTKSYWNTFYNDSVVPYGQTMLKPQKAVYQDFVGPLTGAKEEFLKRRTAQILGIDLLDSNGRYLRSSIIDKQIKNRGIDSSSFGELRAFLIKNKAMSSRASSGGYNLFGMKQLLVDEAFDSGLFNYLKPEQRDVVRDIAGKLKINDPVSKSIGFSKIDGVYQNKKGEIVDLTKIKSLTTSLKDFMTEQFRIPIVRFNPMQMLGVGGPSGVNKFAPIQIQGGMSMQPFGRLESHAAEMFIWTKKSSGIFGSKGNLSIMGQEASTMSPKVTQLKGLYNIVNPQESNIFTRALSYMANKKSISTGEMDAAAGNRDLSFLERMKKRFDVDEEQPNSLFKLASRFRKRDYDINNPRVLIDLALQNEVRYKGGRTLRLQAGTKGAEVVDDLDNVIYDHKQVLRAYDRFQEQPFNYGAPLPFMKELESLYGARMQVAVPLLNRQMGPTDITNPIEGIATGEALLDDIFRSIPGLRARGVDTTGLTRQTSRVRAMLDDTNLSAVSQMAEKSPALSTRLDELRNEIFRLMIQRDAVARGVNNPSQLIIDIDSIVTKMLKDGRLSTAQAAEAKAAGLSTLLNFNALKTFQPKMPTGVSASSALDEFIKVARDPSTKKAFTSLAEPYIRGTNSIINSSGVRSFTAPFKPAFRRRFGVAPYSVDEYASNPLGNQSLTFVPTASTAASIAGGKKVGLNIAGVNSYNDPASVSFASIPMSHGFERLNRYFGTVGAGINVSNYKGPLDLYARGMVMKRALPVVAGGATVLAADRTIGGMVNEKDIRGERVYSPFFLGQAASGVMQAQSLAAGITPGGMGYQEKKEQLTQGEVAIKQGRYWPLGNTPFEGGKTMYYRPSWYKRLKTASTYSSDFWETPAEKLAFGYDFSPLRPFDPYRFERKHYYDRPYPVTGEYFSGPFGPVTSVLNASVGKLLKPQLQMHADEVTQNMAQYVPAGQSGAYNPQGLMMSGRVTMDYGQRIPGTGSYTGGFGAGAPGQMVGSGGNSAISNYNARMAGNAGVMGLAREQSMRTISAYNSQYVSANQYGPPPVPGNVPPSVIGAGRPISHANMNFQAGEIGYRMQETFGIYGFGFASMREGFGFGQGDFEPQRSVLQSASKAYGSSRAFWDLNLGGLGDVPLTAEGALGNIEFSEIIRRFVPKDRTNVNYLNPIRNTMADKYPFLPGADYFINFQQGDPFTKVAEGEFRLPGVGYERINNMSSDYGPLTQLDILADVAPYSKQFRELDRTINSQLTTGEERVRLEKIRAQVEDTTSKYNFSDYKYKGSSPEELGIDARGYAAGRIGEYIAHRDTYFNTKFLNNRTAQEDWERRHVYGATFPQWQNPIESFIMPMLYKSTQRNPIAAAIGGGIAGSFFGATAGAKSFGSLAGFAAAGSYSLYGNAKEITTGERFLPKERKKQMALEEYTDILSYVKNTSLAAEAKEMGDMASANQFSQAAKRTMYGADLQTGSIDTLSLAVPKRKREHFKAMIQETDQEERKRILSTSGRLERRIYQSAWGMKVEERPDLNEYFSRHELPGLSWEGWHPNTNMEHVKIKMGQSMGIEMSQMGYYPQQVREANLTNPSYPTFGSESNQDNTAAQLRALMSRNGISGSVTPVSNPFGNSGIDIFAGLSQNIFA